MSAIPLTTLLAILAGALAGGALFLAALALYGLPPRAPGNTNARYEKFKKEFFGLQGAIAVILGLLTLLATRWIAAGVGIGLLAYNWRSLSGANSERAAIARLEGLATWTESLRDTIAGAVGLEQAIPASTRIAAPAIKEPLLRLVDRLQTRVPMPDALRLFAVDLDDASADLIIAALVINSRLRGPGLRDLLGALSGSVREELDMRRKVSSERRSTRRSVQIVIGVSVGMAIVLALLDRSFLSPYSSPLGQVVLAGIAGLYGIGIAWLRRLAHFETPQRMLGESSSSSLTAGGVSGTASAAPGSASAGHNGAGLGGAGLNGTAVNQL